MQLFCILIVISMQLLHLNAISMHFYFNLNAIIFLFKLKWITIAQNEMRTHWNICFIHALFFSLYRKKKVLCSISQNSFEIHTHSSAGEKFFQCNLYCVSYRNDLKGFRQSTSTRWWQPPFCDMCLASERWSVFAWVFAQQHINISIMFSTILMF